MKSYNQIVEDMKNYIISNMEGENKVTGFHDGSVLLTLIEAFAGELEFIGIDISGIAGEIGRNKGRFPCFIFIFGRGYYREAAKHA